MRIFIVFHLVFILTIQAFSQSIEHLAFKGVPIDGKLSVYIAKMKQNGFEHLGTEDNTALFNGILQDTKIVMWEFQP